MAGARTDASSAWHAALAPTVLGLLSLPLDIWIKNCLTIGITMPVTATVILTKALRLREESGKVVDEIEDAETEQRPMRLDRTGVASDRRIATYVIRRMSSRRSAQHLRPEATRGHEPQLS